jgi:hypothetical protein
MTSTVIRSHILSIAAVVVVAFGLTGCGGGPARKMETQAKVSGSVTLSGKAIPTGWNIVFASKEKGAIAAGSLDSLGKFSLRAGDPAVGIPVGRYEVMLRAPAGPPPAAVGSDEYQKQMMSGASTKPKAEPEGPVPKKFLMSDTSGLVFELKAGENTFDIDLDKLK